MPQEKVKKIHIIYGCTTAALIVATGIALILSCLDIYNSGPRPYSVAAIAAHFNQIAILVYVTIAAILGGIVLNLALPLEKKRPKAIRDELEVLEKLKSKYEILPSGEKEVKKRMMLRLATAAFFVGLMVYPAIYLLDASHFPIENLNGSIMKAALIILIPALVGLLLTFACSLLEQASIRRETELYKTQGVKGQKTEVATPAKINTVVIMRCVLAVAAVSFIAYGIYNGGLDDVLAKAVAICTECIGLG